MPTLMENGRELGLSSANGLRSLLANEMEDVDQAQRLERQWLKLQTADHARLMADNQQVLDTAVAADRALRHQQHRLREWQLAQQGVGGNTDLTFPEADMGDIKIDSPTEIHHHYPTPPSERKPSTGLSPLVKAGLLAAGLAAASAGGFGLNALLNRPTPAPINTKVETREGFLLDLEQAEPKK